MSFLLVVKIFLLLLLVYTLFGFFFAIAFVWKGVSQIDEGAKNSGWGFRLIILPGTMLLWPVLLRKWIQSKSGGS